MATARALMGLALFLVAGCSAQTSAPSAIPALPASSVAAPSATVSVPTTASPSTFPVATAKYSERPPSGKQGYYEGEDKSQKGWTRRVYVGVFWDKSSGQIEVEATLYAANKITWEGSAQLEGCFTSYRVAPDDGKPYLRSETHAGKVYEIPPVFCWENGGLRWKWESPPVDVLMKRDNQYVG